MRTLDVMPMDTEPLVPASLDASNSIDQPSSSVDSTFAVPLVDTISLRAAGPSRDVHMTAQPKKTAPKRKNTKADGASKTTNFTKPAKKKYIDESERGVKEDKKKKKNIEKLKNKIADLKLKLAQCEQEHVEEEPLDLNEPDSDDSDRDDEELAVKKSRSDSSWEAPQCVLCEKHPSTVFAYAEHLQKSHEMTLKKEGIYLKCTCGLLVSSYTNDPSHNKKCNGFPFIIHQLKEPSTPQCVMCEKFPSTAHGYANHLKKMHHNSSLIANGIYLMCKCGLVVTSLRVNPHLNEMCDSKQFTLHKLTQREVSEGLEK